MNMKWPRDPKDVKHQGGFNSIAKPMLRGEGTNQKGLA